MREKVIRAPMNASAPIASEVALSEGQRAALISLLSDEDPFVHQAVREKLLSCGQAASEWLRPHTRSRDPLLRRRALEIVHHLAREAADGRFAQFCRQAAENVDLEQGAWLLAQTQYPDTNLEAYTALIDSYAAELRDHTHPASHPEANLLAINQYLFQRLGFQGNEREYYDPDNSYLNRVVDQRLGNPISLCAIYMMVTRRLGLPVVGIGMPGHFLCRLQTPTCEIYVDCFHRGRFLTKADCMRFLVQNHCGLDAGHLIPVTPRRMLLRMCANLHQSYRHHEWLDDAARFQHYINLLSK